MADVKTLQATIHERFPEWIHSSAIELNELTLEVKPEHLKELAIKLRDDEDLNFKQLSDICGVDYLHYGLSEWETESATEGGFERGVDLTLIKNPPPRSTPRFATVYHLLSIKLNQRVRLRVRLDEHHLEVDSVMSVWPSANWFEREAFDLFGIMFKGHPDLRRILTDYGFIGHPFRKDFPMIGKTEIRYDAKQKRIVYEPVSITPRVLEPKVIRDDNRYEVGE